MTYIERITNIISDKISSELNLDKDKRDIIRYGTFALIQMVLAIVLVVIFGALFNVVIEALIISFAISILRKYSGGVHASNPLSCNIIGTFTCILQAILFSYSLSWITIRFVVLMGILSFTWAYYIILKLAPVDSVAKPIKKEAKRKRLKRISILILSIYLILSCINIIICISKGENKLLIYSICIYGGVLWQTFTLTKIGHILLGKLDSFLNNIFKLEKGVN